MKLANCCEVCASPAHVLARLCKRCKRLIDRADIRRKPDKEARIKALKQAWNGNGFKCYFTGVTLVEDNHHDPRYLTFDHLVPRKEEKIVVVCGCVNDMKSDMSEREFRNVVFQLAFKFNGGAFNEKVLQLKHWKR